MTNELFFFCLFFAGLENNFQISKKTVSLLGLGAPYTRREASMKQQHSLKYLLCAHRDRASEHQSCTQGFTPNIPICVRPSASNMATSIPPVVKYYNTNNLFLHLPSPPQPPITLLHSMPPSQFICIFTQGD